MVRYLNLGCGSRYHSGWINIDIVPAGPGVIAHDLRQGIPLADNSCEAVYHSHVLEHLRRPEALQLLRECYRVLKPGGILRVAIPDLERICRIYLEKLEAALKSDSARGDYDWMMIELYDQAVREQTGGEMREFLISQSAPNEAFVYERIGEEGREIIHSDNHVTARSRTRSANPLISLRFRFDSIMNRCVKVLLRLMRGKPAVRAQEIGAFRLGGEVHQWMYDRYSLARLLMAAGFQRPRQQSPTESQIDNWSSFNLDTSPDGTIIKPDSLFMEATKPI
ncbi:MAG TPA: methyltransferase domain-containing protein [Pyrinomonadaceae bacterium]|nr:methyltransferase domain-containing protein [Pyrinomonadaceae bacterium]